MKSVKKKLNCQRRPTTLSKQLSKRKSECHETLFSFVFFLHERREMYYVWTLWKFACESKTIRDTTMDCLVRSRFRAKLPGRFRWQESASRISRGVGWRHRLHSSTLLSPLASPPFPLHFMAFCMYNYYRRGEPAPRFYKLLQTTQTGLALRFNCSTDVFDFCKLLAKWIFH